MNGWAGRNLTFDSLMIWVSTAGVPLLVLAVAGQWWLRTDQPHTRHVLLAAGFSLLLGLAINRLVLLFIHRVRPYDSGHQLSATLARWEHPLIVHSYDCHLRSAAI
jgi:undecaprenyl-diphosphatase